MRIIFALNTHINFKKSEINKIGGIEHCNFQLAYNLMKLGLDVKLACKIKNEFKYGKLSIIPINNLLSKNLSESCDFLICSNTSKFFYKQKKVNKILWLHNKLQIEKSIRKNELLSIFFNKPNCVFVSDYLKNNTAFIYPFSSKTVIPNGCSEVFLRNKRCQKRKPIFIWSIRRKKGLNEIISMWNNLLGEKKIKAELHIYGLKKSLSMKIIKQYKVNKIKFFGIVDRKALAKKYSYATAMIHPGYDETFCISALEGSASGLPILTLGGTALNERVIHNFNGIKAKNFKEIGIYIEKLLNDKKLFEKLSRGAISYSEKFDWKNISKKWLNLFKKIKYDKKK